MKFFRFKKVYFCVKKDLLSEREKNFERFFDLGVEKCFFKRLISEGVNKNIKEVMLMYY